MTVRDTILVGVDGSEGSRAAVRWAAREAELRHIDLTLLHVYQEVWARADLPDRTLVDVARNEAEAIAADARQVARDAAPAMTVRADAVAGDAAAALVDAAASAGLLVVGNRGRGGFASLMLGSVGQRVATHASVPTVVVRGLLPRPDEPVTVGVDLSPTGGYILQAAFEEAALHHRPLIAVRAYEPPLPLWSPGLPVELRPQEYEADERRALDQALAPWRDKFPDVAVEARLIHGDPTRVLVGLSHTAQLIVVGGHAASGIAGTLLGSVSLKLLHHADCPVLIART